MEFTGIDTHTVWETGLKLQAIYWLNAHGFGFLPVESKGTSNLYFHIKAIRYINM